MGNICGIVGAYRPTESLIEICQNLLEKQIVSHIFIVDDGNRDEKSLKVLSDLKKIKNVSILVHEVNRGQGAGVKTAINHIKNNHLSFDGVVLFDADGQHSFEDIQKVVEAIKHLGLTALVMGSRRFEGKIPFRSRLGNTITRFMVQFLFGISIYDSQCGLRGFGKCKIEKLLTPKCNRYEYVNELNLYTLKAHFLEVPIKAIYFGNNVTSSFRPLLDSFFIYKMYFKHYFLSLRFVAHCLIALISLFLFIK